jgi:L-gulonolactone oxidase
MPPGVSPGGSWNNYASTVVDTPKYLAKPTTTEQVCAIVHWAYERGLRVREVGHGHSWSPVTQGSDVVLDTTAELTHVLNIVDSAADTPGLVTVQSGARLLDVSAAMREHHLVFSNLGQIQYQTVGGVLSTDTHGTGVTKTGFAGMVDSFVLVDGKGCSHRVSRDTDPDLFRATLGGVGLLGVITEATIKVEHEFNILVRSEVLDFDKLIRPITTPDGVKTTELQKMISDNEWFQLLLVAGTKTVIAQVGNRTDQQAVIPSIAEEKFFEDVLERALVRFIASHRRWVDTDAPKLVALVKELVPKKPVVRRNTEAFTSMIERKDWAWSRESEFFLPRSYTEAALTQLNKLFLDMTKAGKYPASPVIPARFVKGDDSFLSPAYVDGDKKEFVAIDMYDTKDESFCFLREARNALAELVANDQSALRLHLGKLMRGDSPDAFRSRYKDWQKFEETRERSDPKNIFLNDWTASLFNQSPSDAGPPPGPPRCQ